METKEVDILIIGAGPAGLTAALYAARGGAKTAVIESMAAGGAVNLTPDIANYPGAGTIAGHELGEKMCEQAETAGAEIVYDEIQNLDLVNKSVKCTDITLKYKALIICTGASPRRLELEREDEFIGAGIHFCAMCDGAFYKGKDVIVVGGGNHAVEEAIYLSPIAASITMIVDVDKLTAQQALVNELNKNIKIYYNSQITKILDGGKLTGVEINNGTVLDASGIFVAVGRVPNTGFLGGKVKLSGSGSIIVDGKMQTSTDGVFAAGDVIEKQVRQVITACADGAVAASSAAEYIQKHIGGKK